MSESPEAATADPKPSTARNAGPRRSALHERHLALGAKLAAFGGWEMPLEYPGGVLKEHAAVREAVGVFDVSHLGKIVVRGPGAAGFVNVACTNDLDRIGPGRAQYTLCCDDATGGVVDDLVVYLRGDDEVLLVPNAANTAELTGRLEAAARALPAATSAGISVQDRHEAHAVIAVQGPRSGAVLEALDLPTGYAFMSFVDTRWRGLPLLVGRTGYTGERGYELLPRAEDAGPLWEALLEAAQQHGGRPCGLGARDTLRTEMGFPLHGQDISLDVTPVQARLSWAVGWDKPAFWGREALVAERAAGSRRLLRGIEAVERAIPRPRMTVRGRDGAPVGEVTSGTFSPTMRKGIGMALLDRSISWDDEVYVDVRGRSAAVRVVKPPFVPASAK
ncbi:MAG: glycine cleavage system aminomethyltransferase GcvT [Carbonactinosporaceae bacterium]